MNVFSSREFRVHNGVTDHSNAHLRPSHQCLSLSEKACSRNSQIAKCKRSILLFPAKYQPKVLTGSSKIFTSGWCDAS